MSVQVPVPALAGRTALVTGAGNGLGRSIALHLGRVGCPVVLVGRTAATLESTATQLDEWDEVFAANVRSIYLMCRAFLPRMYERGDGDVVNLASVTGKRPLLRGTPYAASKMAVIGLTRTLAFEAGPRGIRVNSLSPGPVRGERMARNFRLEARPAAARQWRPSGPSPPALPSTVWSRRTRWARGWSPCCRSPGCAERTSTYPPA